MSSSKNPLSTVPRPPDTDNQRGIKATESHDTSTSPSRVFLLFQRLPVELGLMVWAHACFEPQTIKLEPCYGRARIQFTYVHRVDNYFLGWTTTSPNPNVLSTTQENRNIAKYFYQPLLSIVENGQSFIRYFNPAVDTVHINLQGTRLRLSEASFCPGAPAAIQRLEIYGATWLVPDIFPNGRLLYCRSIENPARYVPPIILENVRLDAGMPYIEVWKGLRHLSFDSPYLSSVRVAGFVDNLKGLTGLRDHVVAQFRDLKAKYPGVFCPAIEVLFDELVVSDLGDTVAIDKEGQTEDRQGKENISALKEEET